MPRGAAPPALRGTLAKISLWALGKGYPVAAEGVGGVWALAGAWGRPPSETSRTVEPGLWLPVAGGVLRDWGC